MEKENVRVLIAGGEVGLGRCLIRRLLDLGYSVGPDLGEVKIIARDLGDALKYEKPTHILLTSSGDIEIADKAKMCNFPEKRIGIYTSIPLIIAEQLKRERKNYVTIGKGSRDDYDRIVGFLKS